MLAALAAFETHLSAGRGLSPNTIKAYVTDVSSFMTEVAAKRADPSEITLDDAKGVYANLYWAPLNLDTLRDAEIAAEIFDTGVNCGIGTAAKLAQRAVNLIRLDSMPALNVDGRMGPVTRQALNTLIDKGYRRALLAAQLRLQVSVPFLRRDRPVDQTPLPGFPIGFLHDHAGALLRVPRAQRPGVTHPAPPGSGRPA